GVEEGSEVGVVELESGVIQGHDRLERRPADLLDLKDLAHVLDHPERHHCARCCVRCLRSLLCGNRPGPIAATAASGVLSITWNILWYFKRQMRPGGLILVALNCSNAACSHISM